ncbi:OadG family transporter subunit [Youngiibacter multivorans]|uniref:Na+-transporting methylmalonyl-CoA/oxaloacetate decarboxylase gamma subunit n=1 Tax=Youngiibacter multivorans TaxID=937251 RepID=A0ABS4G7J2_9CLOT|nr:OadG family transporter subunit [Youngiibacter multivorans]MBP1920527.1 Na+-transporting methylmalonyl-CoA/oxaloacetate decarboxylase gamma subunit [Youngiibacter multivorans]
MDIANFSLMDGIRLSIFAMLVVFLILVLLQFIIYSFKFLPKDLGIKKSEVSNPSGTVPSINSQDEDEMVAMLMASILAKDDMKGNIRIKSIKRIS